VAVPELREVFEMTTKQIEPDVDAWEQQERRQRRSSRNKRLGALAVAAAIGLVAIVLILASRGGRSPTRPAGEPPPTAPAAVVHPFLLHLATGAQTPLAQNLAGGYYYAASPDGTRLVFGTGPDGGCSANEKVTLAGVDGSNAHTLHAPGGLNICGAQWSPDGSELVYQLRDGARPASVGNLFVRDVSSGRTTQLTDLKLSRAWWWFLAPSFSPDGRTVIFQLPRSSTENTKWDAWSVPVTGGTPTLVVRDASLPRYLPDGRRIAFVTPLPFDFAGDGISIANVNGRSPRESLVKADSEISWPAVSPDGTRIAYQDFHTIRVVDVSTGASSKVADGETATWLDDGTLVVGNG
jgi:Tol biopolymer transport system component